MDEEEVDEILEQERSDGREFRVLELDATNDQHLWIAERVSLSASGGLDMRALQLWQDFEGSWQDLAWMGGGGGSIMSPSPLRG